MKRCARLLFVLLLTGTSFVASTQAVGAPTGFVLQYKFTRGQVVRYKVSASDYQPGAPSEVDPTVRFEGILRTETLGKSADGAWTVKLSYEELKVHRESSRGIGYEPKPVTMLPPITLRVRGNGQITNWREYDGRWPGDVEFTDMVNGKAYQRSLNVYRPIVFFLWHILPEGKVETGDKWSSGSGVVPQYAPKVEHGLSAITPGSSSRKVAEIRGVSADLYAEDAASGKPVAKYYDYIHILFLPERGVLRKVMSHRNRATDLQQLSAVEIRLVDAGRL